MVFRQRNSQRFEMDMSAAEVKRAASAQPQPSHRRSRTAPKSSSAACRPKASSTSGATRAARCSTSTTRCTSRTRIEHVLVRHEQAAVHAADGYARATGEVGVALVTSGPGVTNAVTGIATAYMDSIPMVIITGQVPTPAIGLDAFQECDTVGITRPIVKHNFLVKDVRDLALTMKKAFHIARTGRPGPGGGRHPEGRVAEDGAVPLSRAASRCARTTRCARATAGRSARRCSCCCGAKRPYIYTGGGVILGNASAELRELVDLLGYPVHQHADGPGRHRGERPEVPRHARHARHLRSQHDDAELRRAAGRRRALRRPRDRQPEALRVGRAQDHPHRHRPVVDLQARARSTSRSSAT